MWHARYKISKTVQEGTTILCFHPFDDQPKVFLYGIQNQPNPFYRWTVIGYSLPKWGPITLKVYDITGRLVQTLVDQVQWDGKNQSSGVYFYRHRGRVKGWCLGLALSEQLETTYLQLTSPYCESKHLGWAYLFLPVSSESASISHPYLVSIPCHLKRYVPFSSIQLSC